MKPFVPGDRGPEIRDVQRRLVRLSPRSDLVEDGEFGPVTADALRDFQRERGLPAHGRLDAETWRALVEAGYRLGDRLLWHSRAMMRGDDVRELQRRLNQLGFDAGPEDGIFGPLARAAVEEFQRNVGLEVDGIVGHETIEGLRRLHREHQSPGVAARVREREWLRRLSGRSLPGLRVALDPQGGGPDDPLTADGSPSGQLTWALASRLGARLSASGAQVVLTRGPATAPTASQRARLANDQGAQLVLSLGLNSLGNPAASGSASYYFGTEQFHSEAGLALALACQEALAASGCLPDCGVHPMTWALLRETRMPAVVLEPGFVTSAADVARLSDPAVQQRLADALLDALRRFLRR